MESYFILRNGNNADKGTHETHQKHLVWEKKWDQNMLIQNSSCHYVNMREQFSQNWLKGFFDYEVIELLLKLSEIRRDQKKDRKIIN